MRQSSQSFNQWKHLNYFAVFVLTCLLMLMSKAALPYHASTAQQLEDNATAARTSSGESADPSTINGRSSADLTSMKAQSENLISCGALGNPYAYRAGNVDEFASPGDSASPSAALKAAFPSALGWKNFDDPASDRFFGHTFTGLPANIVQARLEIRMKPGNGIPWNDSIALAFTPNSLAGAWSMFIADLPANASHTWNPGQSPRTFSFDLSSLPPSGTRPTNLIAMLAAQRYLDVAIQDDTTVDYIKLFIWTCPLRLNFFGLPFQTLGQARLDRDPQGSVVVSNFGGRGEDGVEIGIGSGAGFNAHWDPLDGAAIPNGGYAEMRSFGVVDGAPNQFIGSIRNTKEGDSFAVSGDFKPLGAVAYEIRSYRLGRLVESHTVDGGGGGPTERAPFWKVNRYWSDYHVVYCFDGLLFVGIGFAPDCPCGPAVSAFLPCYVITYDASNPVMIGNSLADMVAIKLVTSAPRGVSVDSLQLVGSQIPRVTLTGVNIGYVGKPHHALGAATLEPFGGNLTVANIGSSGLDGVSVDLGKTDGFNFSFDPLDIRGLARPGSFIQASAAGSLNGQPDQPLGSFKVTKTGPVYMLAADFPTAGMATQRIQVYSDDTLVADLPGHRGPVGFASSWPRKLGKLGGGTESFTSDFEPGTFFFINGAVYRGNQVRVMAEQVTGVVYFNSAFTLQAAGLGEVTLTGLEATAAPGGIALRTKQPDSFAERRSRTEQALDVWRAARTSR